MPSKDEIYCGVGDVPKGMRRGTPEECINKNQIRYYGLVAIDPSLIEATKKKLDYDKEMVKFQIMKIQIDGFRKKALKLMRILDSDKTKEKDKKVAQKEIDKMKKQKDVLLKRFEDQERLVAELKKDKIREQKELEKANKKANELKKETKKKKEKEAKKIIEKEKKKNEDKSGSKKSSRKLM